MADKARRRARIAEALRKEPIRSQEALREALEGHGIEVTQSALSRDLREMGVIKTPTGYALPGSVSAAAPLAARAPGPAAKPLERALHEFLLSAEAAGQLVVLKTSAGKANALAVELDGAGLPGVVGVLAGDDTIFVAARSERVGRTLLRAIADLAGLKL